MEDKEKVWGYIERSIVDIARKCRVNNTFVIKTFLEKYQNQHMVTLIATSVTIVCFIIGAYLGNKF